jgi:release factor glutamine methyltransferase
MTPPPSPVVTVLDAISLAAQRLSDQAIPRARSEAELLVGAALGRSRESLITHPEHQLSREAQAALGEMVARRAAREPLAYILGEAEFYSLPFYATADAIVPRPETEILVEAVVSRMRSRDIHSAVDVGTGSGVIAVVLARELPQLRVVATDISTKALALARRNCVRHEVSERVSLVCCDLLEALRRPVDCIAANLPYVGSDEFATLQPEVRDQEPRGALDGGADGLGVIRRLSGQLLGHLTPSGLAALEVGAGQAPRVEKLLRDCGFPRTEVVLDYCGVERIVIGWRQG